MDELKKTYEEENNTAVEQNSEVPVAVSDDDVDKVSGGAKVPPENKNLEDYGSLRDDC